MNRHDGVAHAVAAISLTTQIVITCAEEGTKLAGHRWWPFVTGNRHGTPGG